MATKWGVRITESGFRHVLPVVFDLKLKDYVVREPHEVHGLCRCQPTITEDGIIVHNDLSEEA